MNLPPSLIEKLDRLPPFICRLMAKKDGRLMTDDALIETTGWTERKLRYVARAKSWRDVRVGDVDVFLTACGLRWGSQRRVRWLIRKAGSHFFSMQHLRFDRSNGPQVSRMKRHAKRLLKIIGS